MKRRYSSQLIFGVYKRKLLFFFLIIGVIFVALSKRQSFRFQADTRPILSSAVSRNIETEIELSSRGRIKIDGLESRKKANFLPNFDEVRLVIFDRPQKEFDRVTIHLNLPAGAATAEIKHQILAIHGVDSADSYVLDNKTIIYEAKGVSAYATVSIVAEIPKGILRPTFSDRALVAVLSLRAGAWIAVGVILPLLTFFFVISLLFYQSRRQRVDIPEEEISAPPMAIPPALVGVLLHQKVRSREVAATLIDLAVRGDIVILDRERGFSFGKNRFDQRLLGYEKFLLSKIFRQSLSSDRLEIERRINSHFYSRKISLVSAGIYALATRLGYFKINPQRIHLKYRFIGISIFLAGLIGFALSLFIFTNPPFIVFFWIGMMISALIIVLTAPYVPIRTVLGQEALSNWLAFKKYLSNPRPIPFSNELLALFQNYLPYAIVLDCEAAWAKRFSEHNFVLPAWFLTEKQGLGLDDFCLSLFPIISYVSRGLAALREPGFE